MIEYNSNSGGGAVVPNASTTVRGIIELATNAEVIAGIDTERAVVPAALEAWWANEKATDPVLQKIASTYTPGSVLFADALGNIEQDNSNFFWNNTLRTLIIGGNLRLSYFFPDSYLDSSFDIRMRVRNSGTAIFILHQFGVNLCSSIKAADGYCIQVGASTFPSVSVADCFHMRSADITAGNAAPHFRTEAGDIIRLFRSAAIANPAGGLMVDTEARAAINSILTVLRDRGFIAA